MALRLNAPTESRSAIRGNPENEIASFRVFKPRKLAIPKSPICREPTLAQASVVFHGRLLKFPTGLRLYFSLEPGVYLSHAQAREENHRLSSELVEAVARVAELTVALQSARSVPVDTSSISSALTILVNGRIELKDVSADTNPVDLIELAKNLTDIAVELQRARKAKAEAHASVLLTA